MYYECVYVARMKIYFSQSLFVVFDLFHVIGLVVRPFLFVMCVCYDDLGWKNIAINLFILCNYMLSNHMYEKHKSIFTMLFPNSKSCINITVFGLTIDFELSKYKSNRLLPSIPMHWFDKYRRKNIACFYRIMYKQERIIQPGCEIS